MSKFVVDANVAIKWVLPEIHSDVAVGLLDDRNELLVPDFFFAEITNVFWKKVRKGEISSEIAQQNLSILITGDLIICPSFALMSMALETALRINQAVYDCVYLALAVVNQCQMVTADERFYNALSLDRLFSYLCWIEDLPYNKKDIREN